MNSPIEVSAPGKLFLIGEYAVLDGAPALLAAVDRRVHVTLAPSHDDHWHVSAPNLDLSHVTLARNGAMPADIDAATAGKLKVFDAVRRTVVGQADKRFDPMAVTIDSSDFARGGYKLGLGSSAAVAAALTQALAIAADLCLSRSSLAALAIAAHRRAQKGAGSGGDVAVCVYGGLIQYSRDETPVPLTWPATLAGLAVVTGTGASTSDMVARVRDYAERDPDGYAADICRLAWLADTAQHALTRTGIFLQLAREYHEALIALDHHARAGIVSRRHQFLHALAARHHAVFKTSGAGGGDVGLVFARHGPDEHAVREALENAGAHVLPLAFNATGVRVEN